MRCAKPVAIMRLSVQQWFRVCLQAVPLCALPQTVSDVMQTSGVPKHCFGALHSVSNSQSIKGTVQWDSQINFWLCDLHTAQLMPLPFTVSCFSKMQIGTFLVWAYPGSPGKRAVKRVCVWCLKPHPFFTYLWTLDSWCTAPFMLSDASTTKALKACYSTLWPVTQTTRALSQKTKFTVSLPSLQNALASTKPFCKKCNFCQVKLLILQMTHLCLMHADPVHFHLSCCVK